MSPKQSGNQPPLSPNAPKLSLVPTAQLQQQAAGIQNVLAPAVLQAVQAQYQQAVAQQPGTHPDIADIIGAVLQAHVNNQDIQQQETTVRLRQTTEYTSGSQDLVFDLTIRNRANSF